MISTNEVGPIEIAPPPSTLSLQDIATKIINFLLLLAGIIALFYIIYAGILYITSANKPEQAQKAQSAIINVIIGIIVITLSIVLIRFIEQLTLQIIS